MPATGPLKMKILVADDDPISLRMMQRTLEEYGYEVLIATNGREAARILRAPGGPRLALIDWMMPELDGPSVCREVRSRHDSYVYIMLLTGKQSGGDVVEGLKAGADDYLTKPCHPAELQARLHTGQRILQLEDNLVAAREEMHFKATHDGMTTLWNRSAILALLRSELSRANRDCTAVSMLLCDVDHFKQINDVHGHPVGDEVLQEISRRLLVAVRSHDAVGRYGGEEFLIVLSGCGSEGLRHRAEEIRKAIAGEPFMTEGGPLFASLSIGAITVEHWERAEPIEPFLKQADDALYQAKTEGRNRVVFVETAVAV